MLKVKRVDGNILLSTPKYDRIVDRSKFRPNAAVRDRRLGLISGNSSKGLYDFQKGKPQGRLPTDIELALRNGDLDKAEVQVLREYVNRSASAEAADNKLRAQLASEDAKSKARWKLFDDAVGINQGAQK